MTWLIHLLGVAAFTWPFLLDATTATTATTATSRASEAPILVAVLAALLIGMALKEKWTAGEVALLGVLAGLNAVLRIPGSFGGASLMFVLPILCGRAFGARFAFTLGATSMAASALVTGGIGPWLPFQMFALGWTGAGAAFMPKSWGRIGLASYAWVSGFAFGALMNLWFWPFQGGASELSYLADASLSSNLAAYWRFYLVTSFAWDATRAFVNGILVSVLSGSVLGILQEARARLHGTWVASRA